MAEIAWSERALANLDDIIAYLEALDTGAADSLRIKIDFAAMSLRDFPNRGRSVKGTSCELVTVPPYVIRYRVDGDVVTVLHVRHGRQRPPA